ncbi:MAG: wax ester/triacylglycerol synthase family O-acyltransferase [Actinobacteria bacterium]|nr:wax ester/triacylglycerol synthase family O-acyltransferase [Actinomycetota bacterium]
MAPEAGQPEPEPGPTHYMGDADALLWNIEKDPTLRSTITALAVLDSSPDWDRVVAKVDRATRVIPQLRQRVVVPPLRVGPPRWTTDAHFDLDYHLRRIRAPEPGDAAALLRLTEGLGMAGFDRARPLWEFVLIEGLEGGGAALVQKVHHSITDGVGGIKLAMNLLDLDPHPSEPDELAPAPEGEHPTLAGLVGEAVAYNADRWRRGARRMVGAGIGAAVRALQAPDVTAASALRTARSIGRILAPVREPLSPIMRGRSLSARFATIDVPLDDLKGAAKSVDGTLNDAFIAAVTGGLRRYHERHGSPVEQLRMTMPINVRADDDPMAGNRFVPARFPVPAAVIDPAERMRQLGRLVREWRQEPALALTDTLAGILNRLPTSVTTRVFGGLLKGVDFVTSNVPGVPFPVYLGGAEVAAQYAFGPLSGAATNITLVSHCGTCCVGINLDAIAIPDRERFVACLREGFEEVLKLG